LPLIESFSALTIVIAWFVLFLAEAWAFGALWFDAPAANRILAIAQLAWAEIKDDEVTLHNVRSCDYRTETDYTPHWEPRTVRLSQIAGIDLAPGVLDQH
jgi:hypothetical protein